MQRLWANPIKVSLSFSPSSQPLTFHLSPVRVLFVLFLPCSSACVIFQTISLNMCFGFSKNPRRRLEIILIVSIWFLVISDTFFGSAYGQDIQSVAGLESITHNAVTLA